MPGGVDGLFAELGVPVRDWNGKAGVDVLPKLYGAIRDLEDPMTFDVMQAAHRQADDSWDRTGVCFAFPAGDARRDLPGPLGGDPCQLIPFAFVVANKNVQPPPLAGEEKEK